MISFLIWFHFPDFFMKNIKFTLCLSSGFNNAFRCLCSFSNTRFYDSIFYHRSWFTNFFRSEKKQDNCDICCWKSFFMFCFIYVHTLFSEVTVTLKNCQFHCCLITSSFSASFCNRWYSSKIYLSRKTSLKLFIPMFKTSMQSICIYFHGLLIHLYKKYNFFMKTFFSSEG